MRPTVADVAQSRLPQSVGLCSTDLAGICAILNSATQRLLFAREVGDPSWWGGWSMIALNVTRDDPFITLPRGYSGIISLDLCTAPIPLRNQFYEFLQYGFGRFPKSSCATERCSPLQAYDRGTVSTFSDLVPPNKKIRVYLTDVADENKRVLIQGLDSNDIPIRTLDGLVQVEGEFLNLTAPFVDTTNEMSTVSGVQKDITLGRVTFYELDTVSGDERLILTMEPSETVASYRRYYVGGVPTSCCNPPEDSGTVQISALVKLEYIPVSVLTDYLLIPNVEALTEECQAIRYSGMDNPNAKQMEQYHHRNAIRLLQGQSVHYLGKLNPAVSFAPFGSARLEKQLIGLMR